MQNVLRAYYLREDSERVSMARIEYTVIRSKRKTVAIQIDGRGVIVRAPYYISDKEIDEIIEIKRAWIEKHRAAFNEESSAANFAPFSREELCELAEKACEVIPKKVRYYAAKIGVSYGRIAIRNQRTRWGSCSSKGNLNFNCLLMLLPDEIIDSVVVHELCHRKHMNHSADFYAEVEKHFPEYKKCSEWLKVNGGTYLRQLAK